MSGTSRSKGRGFTLLEILVSTALFSMLMGAYYSAFTDILMLEEYAHNQRAFASVGPSILDLIEDDVLSMHTHPRDWATFPMRGQDDSLESEPADSLQFVVRRASVAQEEFFGRDAWVRSPINEIGYRLGRSSYQLGNVRRLFRRESYYVDESPLQGGDYYEVYDRVVSFDICYAGYRAEEEAREDAESLDERNLDRFESWDSEERKGLPSAIIVTIVIEPPQLTNQVRDEREMVEGRDRRTFVRVIPLTQADDIDAPASNGPSNGQPGQNPGQNSRTGSGR